MCGIAGVWFSSAVDRESLESHGRAMGAALRHRGPDAEGVWADTQSSLVLAHRRLSILDLTETGSQPMVSQCGRFVLSYNGECYNYVELRKRLASEGRKLRGSSDTEVILEACARWGVLRTLECLNGMFAFALWDKHTRELVLARDRLGIKPLLYGWSPDGLFWFGSELQVVRTLKQFKPLLDLESLGAFFRYGYVPAPHSIFKGMFKLPAAHFLLLKSADAKPTPECYWPVVRDFGKADVHVFGGSQADAGEELDRLLRTSVRRQMVSDVPLGAFLSGGVDSSLIVALMQTQSDRPVKTFTIGFEESDFNEAKSARKVALHFQTDHTELTLTSAEAQSVVPLLGEMFDEPFADSSQIPTYAVSRLARQHVTVSLSGDGGDELFAGYRHYALAAHRLRKLERLPLAVSHLISAGASALSEKAWDRILHSLAMLLPKGQDLSGHKIHKYASALIQDEAMRRYDLMNARWFAPSRLVRGLRGCSEPTTGHPAKGFDLVELMAAADLNRYLPEDILMKLDRASMAVSLESRVPLLDHEIVAFALSLPLSYKRCNGEGKLVLRRVLDNYAPRKLFDRPKQGFSVPIAAWIRGPLQGWAENLIETARRNHADILNTEIIHTKWQEHLSGRHDWEELLWPVLMFETWAERWL